MIVSELCVYPLKSGRGIELKQAKVNAKGLVWDREMMLVSGTSKFITQRQFPQLAKVEVKIIGSNVTLQSADSPTVLSVTPASGGELVEVEMWSDRILAVDKGDEAARWFHQLLNLPQDRVCRLVQQSPHHVRQLAKKQPLDEERPIGFADNSPVMLTATASLTELNQRIVEIHQKPEREIPMNRFRPNVVIETTEPFIEDSWSTIQIGDIQFEMAKPCTRCIITTIDRERGEKDRFKEPLNTLETFRQLSEKGVMFGVNMIPLNEGIIRQGDRLRVLETRS